MSYTGMTGILVRHASIRGARLDALAARRNTERLLGQAPSVVPGMSASSVLCVRRLSVHVHSQSRRPQPAANFFGGEMARMARQAAQPAHGMVPANAEAVLFMDRAELLECLARDSLHHLLTQGWWWRVLLPGPDLAAAAGRLWVKEAAHAPAALARLARSREAVAFVRTLGEACATGLTQAVIRAHGLSLLADDSVVAMPLPRPHPPAPAMQPDMDARALEAEMRTALPEVRAAGLSRPQRLLLAVSLSLARLPQRVRSMAFSRALPVLLEETGFSFHAKPLSASGDPRAPQKNHVSSFRRKPESSISNGLDTGLRRCDEFLEASGNHSKGKPGTNSVMASSGVACAKPGERHSLAGDRDNEPLHAPDRRLIGDATIAPQDAPPARPAIQRIAAAGDASHQLRTVETQFGGTLFLVNAALALGLYPDFTRPLDRGLEMPLWDFLALAAADMEGVAVKRDPLWPLLAELAGRTSGQRPGAGFVPPREWRLPGAWLHPFAADTGDWVWNTEGTRLVVRHPAGFVVLDLPRTEMPVDEQLQMELISYGAPAVSQAALRRSSTASLARWRNWVMPYLGRRVGRALGDAYWRRACRLLLRLPCRIAWDDERLEAHYPLELLPVIVRIAGLDRDPGWVPAAGCDIRFHFGCDHA